MAPPRRFFESITEEERQHLLAFRESKRQEERVKHNRDLITNKPHLEAAVRAIDDILRAMTFDQKEFEKTANDPKLRRAKRARLLQNRRAKLSGFSLAVQIGLQSLVAIAAGVEKTTTHGDLSKLTATSGLDKILARNIVECGIVDMQGVLDKTLREWREEDEEVADDDYGLVESGEGDEGDEEDKEDRRTSRTDRTLDIEIGGFMG